MLFYLFAALCLCQQAFAADILFTEEDIPGFNLTSCSGAPSCGDKMASYNSVKAYSNGYDQCTGSCCGGSISTGCAYQCVELAQRYFNEKFGIQKIWPVSYASEMCSEYPSGVSKTSNPQPGDLWVRQSGTYGHVAVITAVGSSTVDVLEQNSSPDGVNTYAQSDAGCFLTAQDSRPKGECSNLGYYCGTDTLNKENHPNNLYYCSGAGVQAELSEKCDFTCLTEPSGKDDKCETAGGSCSAVTTGYYCGDDKIDGGENNLYYCVDSQPEGAQKCENGCKTAPSEQDDYCK
jgi:surface antigen